jgi:NDP-sugar pyrophosphorylase family protein
VRYYLSRYLYKKPKDDDYMSLDRVEDLMLGLKPMLSYLAEDLAHKGKKNEAMGICIRNDLLGMIRQDIKEELADCIYDPKKETVSVDKFGPLTTGDIIRLPEHVKVEWIGCPEDI